MSLPQKDGDIGRTAAENEVFKRGLDVMGSCYASVTGTAVVQRKHIPPRPATIDAALYNSTPYDSRGWVRGHWALNTYRSRI